MSDKLIKASDAVDVVAKHSALYGNGEVSTDEGETLLYDIMSEIMNLPSAQPESTRTFVELVVKYPDQELCIYKEYKGKPYFSIKYMENGEEYVGYGTYSPKVLSQYLREYFMVTAQPERKTGQWLPDNTNRYDERYICSRCGCNYKVGMYMGKPLWNFCPNCGSYNGSDLDEQQ